jgi:hypothetical protein
LVPAVSFPLAAKQTERLVIAPGFADHFFELALGWIVAAAAQLRNVPESVSLAGHPVEMAMKFHACARAPDGIKK